MKLLITVAVLVAGLFLNDANAQHATGNCQYDIVFTKCEQPPTFGKDSSDLEKYLAGKLKNDLHAMTGDIAITLIIDSTGKVCFQNLENNSDNTIRKKTKDALVQEMPDWNPGSQKGHKVVCSEYITITMEAEKIKVSYRIGTRYSNNSR